ncbi:ABC transporter permease [Vibrio nomapromontoriensis]|uniref:ABC transporter permease n=1 Tax=Vibrio nomapromontoriensis TaxID=2910246 RepID=UPI003D0D29E8
MLRLLYGLLVVVCILPTIPGLLGVVVASLGYIPPLNLYTFSLDGFIQVLAWQGVETSLILTLFTTLASSYLACVVTFFILESCWNRPIWNKIELALSPLLAMPHVAFAIGFAFLFAPTGFGIRMLLEFFDIHLYSGAEARAWLIKDPYGVGLTLMLALKEVPFLLLMSIPIVKQLKVQETIKVASALGYRHHVTWWKVIMPQWFNKMRFPILAVIAYSLSVVDVALVLGPTNPPTFAVLVWQWFNDPDLQLLPRASAGAVMLFIIASLLILLARLIESIICSYAKQWQYSGRWAPRLPGKIIILAIITLSLTIVPLLITWSFAQRWRFPDIFPSRFTLRFWQYEWHGVLDVLSQSLSIALVSATIALFFAIIGHEYRLRYRWQIPGYVIAIPMLIPQLSILFGLQIMTLVVSDGNYAFWVCWSHVFFAFPFVYLSLDGPWRSYNEKLTQVSLSLGKGPVYTWIHVKLPQLLPAIVFAWAVGMSVSLAQYLPTLVLGAGRISTVTTEAVALSSGFDRRVTAIYALFQALLPLLFFTLAVLVSRLNTRYRRVRVKGLRLNDAFSRKPHHP